jgi:molybdenum cofactor cytidylyltransferase
MAGELEGILLAAGESRRMGFPKPLLRIGEETFIEHVALGMLAVVSRLVVVLGAHAERIRVAVPGDSRIEIVENPSYQNGQLSSLKVGLRALRQDCAAAMVHLADHPAVRLATFEAMAAEYMKNRAPIVIARCDGRRGHPVIFGRSVFAELMSAPEEQGARAVVNADPARVSYLEVDDGGVTLDLDTPEDLARAGFAPAPRRITGASGRK